MTLFLALGLPTRASAQDGGVIIYPGKEAGPVVFSHAAHGKKSASRSCKECHRDGGGRKLDISMEGIRQG